jgi:hypothetical protein
LALLSSLVIESPTAGIDAAEHGIPMRHTLDQVIATLIGEPRSGCRALRVG